MESFMNRYASEVKGAISGWDRLAFRGTIRWLASAEGLSSYLLSNGILFKDFKTWAMSLTKRIRSSCEEVAKRLGIEAIYLRSSSTDKEALAREIAKKAGIKEGPICMLSVVEPSFSPTVVGDVESHLLKVAMRQRKCVWLYFYFNDAEVGFGHLRLSTWLPFTIQGCLNGRHWLERSLMHEGIGYIKQGNCFRAIDDVGRAQELANAQLNTDWPVLLARLSKTYFPIVQDLLAPNPLQYYWSADATEWATDIMFRNTKVLDRLFPMLARHALTITDSAKVMRFLGKIPPGSELPPRISGDVRGDRVRRHEGICVKHRAGKNTVKIYNKAGNVLRTETTINDTRAFKVFRRANDDAREEVKWQRMRKGVADLQRRARISQSSNVRYLDMLAACPTDATFIEVVSAVCKGATRNGRRVRALNPSCQSDLHLLRFLTLGQWTVEGFRNRDLSAWLDPQADKLAYDERRRLSARASRLLFILKTHGLIRRVQKTHRYLVTRKGLQVAQLMVCISSIQIEELIPKAA
jgi:hypothetical protein